MSEFEKKLADYLVSILENEKKIELIRQSLARCNDFEPYTIFCRFDRDKKKYLNFKDFERYFKENSLKYSEDLLRLMLFSFDTNNDSVIDYQEFLRIILTKNDHNLRAKVTQKYPVSTTKCDYLNFEIEYLVSSLFEKELSLIKASKENCFQIKRCANFNLKHAFNMVDCLNFGKIEDKNLGMFLKQQGFSLNQYEIYSLISRMDRSDNKFVNFQDFSFLFLYESNDNYACNKEQYRDSRKSEFYDNLKDKETNYSFKTTYDNKNSIINTKVDLSEKTTYTYPENSKYGKTLNFESNNQNSKNYRERINLRSISPQIVQEFSIIEYIDLAFSLDKKLEEIRQFISLNNELKIDGLFQYFDFRNNGLITLKDFKDSLFSLRIDKTESELKPIFKLYDKDNDGSLNYNEFLNMIFPYKKEYYLNSRIKQFSNIDYDCLSLKSKNEIRNLFNTLINNEIRLEEYRGLIKNCNSNIDFLSWFNRIKKNFRNFFSLDDMKTFVELNGKIMTEEELKLIFIRFDKNEDGKVTYNEFVYELTPQSSYNQFI